MIQARALDQHRQAAANERGGGLGQRAAPVWRAELVRDDPELIAFGREPANGQQEIAAAQPIDPAGAEYQARAARGGDRALAGELAGPYTLRGRAGACSSYGAVAAPSNT